MRPVAIVRNLKILYGFSAIIIESHSVYNFLSTGRGKTFKTILRISIFVYKCISIRIYNPLFSRIFRRCCRCSIFLLFHVICLDGCCIRNRTYLICCFTFNRNDNFFVWFQRLHHKAAFADKLFIRNRNCFFICSTRISNDRTDTGYCQIAVLHVCLQVSILDDNILCRSISIVSARNGKVQCLICLPRNDFFTILTIDLFSNRQTRLFRVKYDLICTFSVYRCGIDNASVICSRNGYHFTCDGNDTLPISCNFWDCIQ